jgi:PAS domain S-box-containing protein
MNETAETRELAEVSRSRDELELILQAITAGITMLDPRGVIIYANDVAAQACGFRSSSEMLGMTAVEVAARFQFWREDGEPLAQTDLPSSAALRGQEAQRLVRFGWAAPRGVDRWLAIRSAPMRDGHGRLTRVVNVFRDVTERIRVEHWQRFVSEASAALATSKDARLVMQAVADLAIRTVAELCTVDVGAAGHGRLARVASARAPWLAADAALDGAGPSPDGKQRDAARLRNAGGVSRIVVPLSARGEVIGALTLASAGRLPPYAEADRAAAEDLGRHISITIDNVRLYGEAQEALRAREDLLAIVSHDLRNPLGVVLASSALLLKSSLPPEKDERARRQVEAIQRAGHRMNRLIRDLLDFASIQGGRLAISRREHDAGELLGVVVDTLEPLAVQKSLQVCKELGLGQLPVWCDHDRMIQALSNVLGNAIKFTPDGGTIRVGIERDGDGVRFFVADTGPGIPADERDHVFDRYFQARRRNREGIGLGLSIAKGIVDAHGGRIWVESEEGKGCTFFVAMPPGE